MGRLYHLLLSLAAVLLAALPACQKASDSKEGGAGSKELTVIFGTQGLNDLVYNDLIQKGVMAAQAGCPELVLHPKAPASLSEARSLVSAWKASTVKDKALVLCGREYESLVDGLDAGTGRVLLLDSGKSVGSGCSSARIKRYGTAWLAGALLKDKAPVLVKDPDGDPVMDLLARGFEDGYKENGGEKLDTITPETELLQALYQYGKWYSAQEQIIVPACGALQFEAFLYINHQVQNALGMGTDFSYQSDRIPFSLSVDLTGIVQKYITDWARDIPWEQQAEFGLSTGHVAIIYNKRYFERGGAAFPQKSALEQLYAQFYSQALEKEAAHEN